MKKVVKLLLVGTLIMGLLVSVVGCGGEPAKTSEKQTEEKAADKAHRTLFC